MTQKTLHMIGNAHIDPVWLWNWQEGFHEVKASFRSALDRMQEYPDFKFVSSSAVFYEWVEKSDPQMFDEIRARVQEGRWEIVGGWWLQPDCNIPSGESFVRQGLYGQRYFKEKFGVTARVGYNVDSFGHSGMLPQILKKSGLDYYVFMRPHPHEMGLPGRVFWWQSDDGSRVLTFRIPYTYETWGVDLDQHITRCAAEIKAPGQELMCFYGVGNHGGGPTKENIESIQRLQKEDNGLNLLFSTPNQFFEAATTGETDFPVVHQDLQMHAIGCYAAHSGVKQWNRRAENRLLAAEKWATVASLAVNQPYPEDFDRAWKAVLFNQFHDILAGTSLESAYEDARDLYGEAMSIADRALNYAVQAIAWQINTPYIANSLPIVVFNPHPWEIQCNVELETRNTPQPVESVELLNDKGHPVPMQFVQSHSITSTSHRLSFQAKLPALGYGTYHLVKTQQPTVKTSFTADNHSLENEALKLVIDPETGFIKSLYDKENNLEVFSGPAAKPVVIDDPSDTWSHNLTHFSHTGVVFHLDRVHLVENGPAKATLRVESRYEQSRLIQDFSMFPGQRRVDVHVTVDWHEQQKLLKLRFPVNLNFTRITYETAYGHIERPANGEEEPGQNWVDVSGVSRDSGGLYGLSLLNDAKYSYDFQQGELGLTVLRSPIYAHHIPRVPSPDEHYTYIDQGIQRFSYALLPHSNGWEDAQAPRHAAVFNQPPITLVSTFHDGPLPQKRSYLTVDAPNVLVSVLKQAEDGDDLILRAYETNRTPTTTTIHLPLCGREFEATFGPCEIKTFRIPRDVSQPIVETNLLEWEMAAND